MSNTRVAVGSLVVTAATLVGIATYEGYTDKAIQPVPGDSWTYGFGETKGVKQNDKTSPVRALVQLMASVDEHASGMKRCLGPNASLYEYEYSAYLSLTYNIGVGAFCKSSIPVKVQAGQYEEACKTILLYNKAQGKVLKGLQIRREKEYKTCTGQ